MTLIVHHMQVSQSERIVWLCEELQIPYELVLHQRDPLLAPQSIKDLNPMGQSPVIQDDDLTLAETAACVDYIVNIHGGARLTLPPTHKDYASYIYWFHFCSGSLSPAIFSLMFLSRIKEAEGTTAMLKGRLDNMLAVMDARLGKTTWLAGDDFTVADIMVSFPLTTVRVFYPLDLTAYPNILAYLSRMVEREAYKKARAKGDPGLEVMISGEPPLAYVERLKAQGQAVNF